MEVQRAIESIVSDVLSVGRKRSMAYRLGVLDALQSCATGSSVPCPYREGSPKCDAYIAGLERGNHIWLERYESGAC